MSKFTDFRAGNVVDPYAGLQKTLSNVGNMYNTYLAQKRQKEIDTQNKIMADEQMQMAKDKLILDKNLNEARLAESDLALKKTKKALDMAEPTNKVMYGQLKKEGILSNGITYDSDADYSKFSSLLGKQAKAPSTKTYYDINTGRAWNLTDVEANREAKKGNVLQEASVYAKRLGSSSKYNKDSKKSAKLTAEDYDFIDTLADEATMLGSNTSGAREAKNTVGTLMGIGIPKALSMNAVKSAFKADGAADLEAVSKQLKGLTGYTGDGKSYELSKLIKLAANNEAFGLTIDKDNNYRVIKKDKDGKVAQLDVGSGEVQNALNAMDKKKEADIFMDTKTTIPSHLQNGTNLPLQNFVKYY